MTHSQNSMRHRIATAWLALIAATVAAPSNTARSQTPDALDVQIDKAMRKADQFEKEGKFAGSIALMEKTVESARRELAADDPLLGAALDAMGRSYFAGGRYDDAETSLREALRIARTHPDETATFRFSCRNSLVTVLSKKANYTEALPLCEESLKEIEAARGPDDWQTNMARNSLAAVYLQAKRPADAIPVSRLALKYALARYEADDPETIPFRNTLSMALLQDAQYPEAERLFKESLAIAEKRLRPGDESTIATLTGLASVCQQTDRNEEAAAYSKRASGVTGAVAAGGIPKDEANDPLAINNSATALMLAGKLPEAERDFLRALELYTEKFGPDHPETSKILSNLAGLYTRWARFADAARYAQRALANVQKNPGRGTVAEAMEQQALGAIYFSSGRYDDAETVLEAAHTTLQNRLEPGHPTTLMVLHNLSDVYQATNRYDKAVEYGESALADLQKRIPGDTSYTAMLLLNIGQSYMRLNKLDKAEDRLVRAVAIFQKVGRVTRDSAAADSGLADLYAISGRPRDAEAVYRRSAEAMENWYGPDHPDTMTALDKLAVCRANQMDWKQAVDLFDRTRKLRRSFLARTLPALSDDDQFSLIETGENMSRDSALFVALMHHAEPGLPAQSAEWALNSKAVALRAQAEQAVLARDVTNPEAVRLLAERETIRARLAAADPSSGKSESEIAAALKAYRDLVTHEKDLSRQLGLAVKTASTVAGWVGIGEVRDALPADAVLVEFARIQTGRSALNSPKNGEGSARYAAWVIPPAGGTEVRLVDLGPADAIERALSAALRAVQVDPASTAGSPKESDAEREALVSLEALSKSLLGPLRAQLDPAKRWVLSPDSALWLVPWAALPVGDGRYAVEDHLIYLIPSGRDLLDPTSPATSAKPAILADPDYDLSADKVVAKANELNRVRSSTRPARSSSAKTRALLAPTTVDRLAGFRNEALAVAPLMKEYAALEPDVFLDAAASETVFKNLRGPQSLLLSTHGFFESAPEPTADAGPLSPGPARRPAAPAGRSASPLLRCGLALAGFNASHGTDGLDDGLLTGLEVVGVDLRGTEVVVLSACETALGEVRSGEGVAGLRQSFQLAGARAVVASLWKVPDNATYRLIASFFRGLANRKGPATALRDAQLALIADRRAQHGAAHPYFWAAFSLTGFPGASWRDEPLTKPGSAELKTLLPSPADELKAESASSHSHSSHPAISPVTGRPDVGGPWSDLSLATTLFAGALYGARRWWLLGQIQPSAKRAA